MFPNTDVDAGFEPNGVGATFEFVLEAPNIDGAAEVEGALPNTFDVLLGCPNTEAEVATGCPNTDPEPAGCPNTDVEDAAGCPNTDAEVAVDCPNTDDVDWVGWPNTDAEVVGCPKTEAAELGCLKMDDVDVVGWPNTELVAVLVVFAPKENPDLVEAVEPNERGALAPNWKPPPAAVAVLLCGCCTNTEPVFPVEFPNTFPEFAVAGAAPKIFDDEAEETEVGAWKTFCECAVPKTLLDEEAGIWACVLTCPIPPKTLPAETDGLLPKLNPVIPPLLVAVVVDGALKEKFDDGFAPKPAAVAGCCVEEAPYAGGGLPLPNMDDDVAGADAAKTFVAAVVDGPKMFPACGCVGAVCDPNTLGAALVVAVEDGTPKTLVAGVCPNENWLALEEEVTVCGMLLINTFVDGAELLKMLVAPAAWLPAVDVADEDWAANWKDSGFPPTGCVSIVDLAVPDDGKENWLDGAVEVPVTFGAPKLKEGAGNWPFDGWGPETGLVLEILTLKLFVVTVAEELDEFPNENDWLGWAVDNVGKPDAEDAALVRPNEKPGSAEEDTAVDAVVVDGGPENEVTGKGTETPDVVVFEVEKENPGKPLLAEATAEETAVGKLKVTFLLAADVAAVVVATVAVPNVIDGVVAIFFSAESNPEPADTCCAVEDVTVLLKIDVDMIVELESVVVPRSFEQETN